MSRRPTRDEEAAREAAALKTAEERRRYLDSVRRVMSTPDGRAILAHLMDLGAVFATTFTGNSGGMFLEGRRSLALELVNDTIETDRDLFILTLAEHQHGGTDA